MDMRDKTVIITGATDGIGKETARVLAEMRARVIIVSRTDARGERTVAELIQKSGNKNINMFVADLSSINDIKNLSEKIHANCNHLHVLINNAGVFLNNKQITIDGYEATFAINHLAYFYLTNLLLDLLVASAPSRIINVSSMAHSGSEIDFDNLNAERSYSGFQAYSQSKLANLLFTYELHRRVQHLGVTVNALHPGVINTKLLKAGWGGMGESNIARGAETSIYLATSPRVDGVSGQYFVNKTVSQSSRQSHDQKMAEKLWQISEELTEHFDYSKFSG